ncbi:halocyanin domain-containing protein [Halorussus amylolyticus]|uniref:halocyanin domain-containing protein n=1 Tax=Halorussus amylolyticus TaxID=1126242 RepID=UPI00104DAE66|nr:halocyanin domain-containing protein [Halorussus amylolyticus]
MRDSTTRRDFLRGTATATAAATATAVGASAAATPAAAQSETDLDAWFDGVENYDGVEDMTGEDEVTIEVGAQGNGGGFAFGPAAVRIDPGTTVVWEWTGVGGSHNVATKDGAFESEMTDEEGHTFEYTADEEGVFRYVCVPHESMGMKGALVVGDTEVGAAASGGWSGTEISPGLAAVGGSVLLGILSPIAFAAFLFGRGSEEPATDAHRPELPTE